MGASARCPYCGAVRGDDAAVRDDAASGSTGETRQAIDALYREVARIRELAEHPRPAGTAPPHCDGGSREALLREIALLRETVARLRGTSPAAGS
jgi:hypothetical protein